MMLEGRRLNDRYQIREAIGGGGMANVYLARDLILDRDVAIKVLRLEYSNDEEFINRFRREAQSAISLSHPNIVNIFDVGEEDDIYYIVMEYVPGMTLKKYIQKYGPLEVDESLDIIQQIISAISHAHQNHIIHRDIKPQNILIDHSGHVKVTDFGIAMALSATTITHTNSVLGSVHYLSPEQARGGMATKKSDVYSLGIVLFELLSGRLPFSGQSAVSIALKHLQSETPSLRRWNPELPQSVENVVLKATAKDPFHRYDSIQEMGDDLATALDVSRRNEPKFYIPDDGEEVTKAIPIITNDTFKEKDHTKDTIVHKAQTSTKTKNSGKKKATIWIASIFGVLFLAALAAIFILPGLLKTEEIQIPDVVGEDYEDAYSELTELGLKVKREPENSAEVEEGKVIRTDPNSGSTVKEGAEITVYSSLGKEKVEFDDYVGQQYSQVATLLERDGWSITKIGENSDEPEGVIIEQIQPAPGDLVLPENTKVIFKVSEGPEKITLRDLTGKTEQDVLDYFKEDLSTNVKYEYSDTVEEGKVISQDPKPYEEVEKGTEVTITLSMGPEELPPQNVTKTVPIDVDEEDEIESHQVTIYIGDADNDITDVYRQLTITKDESIDINLIIASDSEAVYRVMLDGELYMQETVPYKEGEEE